MCPGQWPEKYLTDAQSLGLGGVLLGAAEAQGFLKGSKVLATYWSYSPICMPFP